MFKAMWSAFKLIWSKEERERRQKAKGYDRLRPKYEELKRLYGKRGKRLRQMAEELGAMADLIDWTNTQDTRAARLRIQAEEYWVWQEEGGNEIASLGCPVIVQPRYMQALLAFVHSDEDMACQMVRAREQETANG